MRALVSGSSEQLQRKEGDWSGPSPPLRLNGGLENAEDKSQQLTVTRMPALDLYAFMCSMRGGFIYRNRVLTCIAIPSDGVRGTLRFVHVVSSLFGNHLRTREKVVAWHAAV
jgi:hypothetical protein